VRDHPKRARKTTPRPSRSDQWSHIRYVRRHFRAQTDFALVTRQCITQLSATIRCNCRTLPIESARIPKGSREFRRGQVVHFALSGGRLCSDFAAFPASCDWSIPKGSTTSSIVGITGSIRTGSCLTLYLGNASAFCGRSFKNRVFEPQSRDDTKCREPPSNGGGIGLPVRQAHSAGQQNERSRGAGARRYEERSRNCGI